MSKIIVVSGTSNLPLAKKVARLLRTICIKPEISKFPNGEYRIRVVGNLQNKDIIVIQSGDNPNENFVELLLLIDAINRLKPRKIIAVIPWLSYSPQITVFRKGEPLSSKVIINILDKLPINYFVFFDIHDDRVIKFFKKTKTFCLSACQLFCSELSNICNSNWVAISLDNGATEKTRILSHTLGIPFVELEKHRSKSTGQIRFNKIKEELKNKNAISVDDFISTGSTSIMGCKLLKQAGIKKYYQCAAHLVVKDTIPKLLSSQIDKILLTDSLNIKVNNPKIKVLSIAPIISSFITNN